MTKDITMGMADKEVSLGQVLRGLRKAKKLKQQDVSEYLGVERVTCSAYENDRIFPPADKLYKLAELYGISIELLASKTLIKHSNETVNNSEKAYDSDLKNAEMIYYYKSLDDSKKRIVFDLIKELYGK